MLLEEPPPIRVRLDIAEVRAAQQVFGTPVARQ